MFIELTDLDNVKILINVNSIIRIRRNTGDCSTYINLSDLAFGIEAKETPAQIEQLLNESYVSVKRINVQEQPSSS